MKIIKKYPILSTFGLLVASILILHLKHWGEWHFPKFSYFNLVLVIINISLWLTLMYLIAKKLIVSKKIFISSTIVFLILMSLPFLIQDQIILLFLFPTVYIVPMLLCPHIDIICETTYNTPAIWTMIISTLPVFFIISIIIVKTYIQWNKETSTPPQNPYIK